MKTKYDVIIICFSDPTYDARTINLVKTLLKYDRKVCLVTPDYQSQIEYLGSEHYIRCKINLNQSVNKSQSEFKKRIKSLKLGCNFVLASDYYSLGAAKYIKSKSGAKLIYDSREIYSKLNSLTNRPFAQKYIELAEKFLITYVDKIIVSAPEDEIYLKKHFMHNIKYSIIRNLPPKFNAENNGKLREKYKIPAENLLLLYQGWILEGRGLDTVFESMSKLENTNLVLIGKGNYQEKLKRKASELQIEENVHFAGVVTYDELMEYTCSADVGLVLFENSSISYRNALPNKLFEFIQCKISVITTNQKTMSEIVSENNIGIVLDQLNSESLIDAITKIRDKKRRSEYSDNTLKIREKYSYESQEVEILKVFS